MISHQKNVANGFWILTLFCVIKIITVLPTEKKSDLLGWKDEASSAEGKSTLRV